MIKNKSVFIVVFCLVFSFSASYCAQESWTQQFSNWIYTKFHHYFGVEPKRTTENFHLMKTPTVGFSTLGLVHGNLPAVAVGASSLIFFTAIGTIEDIWGDK